MPRVHRLLDLDLEQIRCRGIDECAAQGGEVDAGAGNRGIRRALGPGALRRLARRVGRQAAGGDRRILQGMHPVIPLPTRIATGADQQRRRSGEWQQAQLAVQRGQRVGTRTEQQHRLAGIQP
ncbi:hypothetical protein D3C71_1907150 [compost metagenome]